MIVRKLLLVLVLCLLGAACQSRPGGVMEGTPALNLATPTLPATPPPARSETPLPLPTLLTPPSPTQAAPVEGMTSTQVNVRSEPSTGGSLLGIIPAGTRVDIVGRDPGGNWWQILYPQGAEGKGWVTAQYVTAADPSAVPAIGGGGVDPGDKSIAIVQEQINVRSGPGTDFNSLGTLNPRDVVDLTGRDASGTWLQIAYASGPDGQGWVNAGFVQAQGVETLPIVTEGGEVLGTGTPTGLPPTPTPTLVPAPVDNDSAENPIVSVTFAPSGTHTLIYNGDVSAPAGDREDWIRFVPFSSQVWVEVSCTGSDVLVDFIQSGQSSSQGTGCASQFALSVEPDVAVELHVHAAAGASQVYSSYTIKVKTIP